MAERPKIDCGKSAHQGSQGGFTLIELLIVIVILAVLSAIVVFAVGTTSKNAVAASCSADAKSVESALTAYDAQTGTYPGSLSLLTTGQTVNGTVVGPWLHSLPGTSHYNMFDDASGDLFIDSPGDPSMTGVPGTAGTITVAAIAVGGPLDFDANPSVCGQFA